MKRVLIALLCVTAFAVLVNKQEVEKRRLKAEADEQNRTFRELRVQVHTHPVFGEEKARNIVVLVVDQDSVSTTTLEEFQKLGWDEWRVVRFYDPPK